MRLEACCPDILGVQCMPNLAYKSLYTPQVAPLWSVFQQSWYEGLYCRPTIPQNSAFLPYIAVAKTIARTHCAYMSLEGCQA